MSIIKNAIPFGSGFNITASGPIDSRMRVEYFSDLTTAFGSKADPNTAAPAYEMMQVSVIENHKVYKLAGDDPSVEANWIEIGAAEAVALSAANYSAAIAEATSDNVGQIIYVSDEEYKEASVAVGDSVSGLYVAKADTDPVEYEACAEDAKAEEGVTYYTQYTAGPYIVTGSGNVAKLGTTSASGDIQGTVNTLSGEVSTLNTEVEDIDKVLNGDGEDVKGLVAEIGKSSDAADVDGSLYARIAAVKETADSAVQTIKIGDSELSATSGVVDLSSLENKIEVIKVNGVEQTITNKAVDITIEDYTIKALDTASDGAAKSYQLYKGENAVSGSIIDIPTDLVVSSGTLVDASATPIIKPESESKSAGDLTDDDYLAKTGKYIKLVLNNSDKIYIAVSDLVDVYKVADDSGLTLDSSTNTFGTDSEVLKANLGINTLVADLGAKAVNYSAEEIATATEGDAAYGKTTSDVKTAATGVYAYVDNKVANAVTAVTLTGSDSIDITSNVVSVKIASGDDAGNVTLESTSAGLKASLDWMEI